MQIEILENTVKQLKINDASGLDLVNVYLENIAPGQGRILIECWGESWTAYWGAMSGMKIEDFFTQCENSYLTDRLEASAKGHKLKYLTKIVDAVKEALKQIKA